MEQLITDFKTVQARWLDEGVNDPPSPSTACSLTEVQEHALNVLAKKADRYLRSLRLDGYEYVPFK